MREIGDEASWEPVGPCQAGDDGRWVHAVREEVERRGQVNRNNASDLVAGCGGEISQT